MRRLERIVDLLRNSSTPFLPLSELSKQLRCDKSNLLKTIRDNKNILGKQCVLDKNKRIYNIVYLKEKVDVKQVLLQDCNYSKNRGQIVEQICEMYCMKYNLCRYYQKYYDASKDRLLLRTKRWLLTNKLY